MKRSQAIQLSIVTSVAATLLSCDGTPPTRYCVDQDQRVLDERACQQPTTGGHYWYYGGRTGYVPTGTRITGGSFETPSEGFTTSSGSVVGGTVRGGIGASGDAAAAHAGGGAAE